MSMLSSALVCLLLLHCFICDLCVATATPPLQKQQVGNATAPFSGRLPPSVVLLLVDDLGFNNVPWNSGSIAKMPHTQALYEAAGSVALTAHHAQRWCAPTRASLLTGRYPFRIGWNEYGRAVEEERSAVPFAFDFLPKVLKERAFVPYATAMVGKYHLGFFHQKYTPCGRGFDEFFGFLLGSATHDTHNSWGRHTCNIPVPDLYNCTGPAVDSIHYKNMTYSAEMYGEIASDILHRHADTKPQQPLFLYVSFQGNHAPFSVPDQYLAEFPHLPQGGSRRIYNAMNFAVDAAIGRILAALESRSEVYVDPVIIFTSDNGGPKEAANNLPLRGAKFGLFEGSTRTNAFIHSSRLKTRGSGSYQGLFHISDWYPTIAELAGVSHLSATGPQGFEAPDGVSHWTALLNDTQPPPRTEIVHDLDFGKSGEQLAELGLSAVGEGRSVAGSSKSHYVSLRSGDFKLIYGAVGDSKWIADADHTPCESCCPFRQPPLPTHPEAAPCTAAWDSLDGDISMNTSVSAVGRPPLKCTAAAPCLFNIREDPEERANLFRQTSYGPVVKRMKARLQFWRSKAYSGLPDMAATPQARYCEMIAELGWVQPFEGQVLAQEEEHLEHSKDVWVSVEI